MLIVPLLFPFSLRERNMSNTTSVIYNSQDTIIVCRQMSWTDLLPRSYLRHNMCKVCHSTPVNCIVCNVTSWPGCMWICSLLFYFLPTSKVISGWVLTCNSARSSCLYSAAPLGEQAVSTMTWYPTQSYYPDTEPTSPCFILIMPSAWLWSDKYNTFSHWFDFTMVQTHEVRNPHSRKTGD